MSSKCNETLSTSTHEAHTILPAFQCKSSWNLAKLTKISAWSIYCTSHRCRNDWGCSCANLGCTTDFCAKSTILQLMYCNLRVYSSVNSLSTTVELIDTMHCLSSLVDTSRTHETRWNVSPSELVVNKRMESAWLDNMATWILKCSPEEKLWRVCTLTFCKVCACHFYCSVRSWGVFPQGLNYAGRFHAM